MQRHPFDPVSLVFGALFAGLGLFLLVSDTWWTTVNAVWLVPVILLAVGAAVLVPALQEARRTRD